MNKTGPNSARHLAIAAALCAILILPVAWHASQGWIYPDSVSYMDMATGALRESPTVLLKNAYWSPAYPAILALMMIVARPSPSQELHAMYTVHWLIFLVTTTCLTVFLSTFLQWLRRNSWPELAFDGTLSKAVLCFSYGFFLVSNMNPIIWYLTPDMLLQGTVYLAAACSIRLFLPDSSWKHSAALGLTLGIGYLTKAAMFPVALMLIGILYLKPPKDYLGRRHTVIALTCFCLAAAPLVLSLSYEKRRLTFGDSGKLNYAFVITDVGAFSGWLGQRPEYGVPAHAPRAVSLDPMVLEFRSPVRGTLPIWYDPSYWWEGLKIPIDIPSELAGILRPFQLAHSVQMLLLALAAALTPLCLLNFRVRRAIREGGIQTWILIAWPAAACLMYMLVLFSFRYVLGYMVLAGIGSATILLQLFRPAVRVRVLLVACLLLALAGTVRLRPIMREAIGPAGSASLPLEEDKDNAPTSAAIAQGLARLGIRPGDEISVVGHSLDSYYARLAGIRIVAQIWEDPDKIAGLSASRVHELLAELRKINVKALVSRTAKPGFINDEGWVAIPNTNIFIRML